MSEKEQNYLTKVILSSDVYSICLQHALSTEKEEIMGLLIGEIDETGIISHISSCVALHRSDKKPDRVEISATQLCEAASYAESLQKKLKKPMRVIGWYHSHPHITVWPSTIDLQTQQMYQGMEPYFVGLIFSVFTRDKAKGNLENQFQLTCFQSSQSHERIDIPVVIENFPLQKHNMQSIVKLPKILIKEEIETQDTKTHDKLDPLVELHNQTYKVLCLTHLIIKFTRPMCDEVESRLSGMDARIKALQDVAKKLKILFEELN